MHPDSDMKRNSGTEAMIGRKLLDAGHAQWVNRDIWKESEPAFYADVVRFAQEYVNSRIPGITQKFPLRGSVGNLAVTKLVYEAEQLSKAVSEIKFPAD